MSKSKKTPKISARKETSAEFTKTEKLDTQTLGSTTDNSPNKNSNYPFSFLTDEVKEKMQSFMNSGIGSMCNPNGRNNYEGSIVDNMITKLSNNIRRGFEENMELGQEVLKCKTAADFIEFQRKNFEINYKNTIKIYEDLFYDIKSLAAKSLNSSKT